MKKFLRRIGIFLLRILSSCIIGILVFSLIILVELLFKITTYGFFASMLYYLLLIFIPLTSTYSTFSLFPIWWAKHGPITCDAANDLHICSDGMPINSATGSKDLSSKPTASTPEHINEYLVDYIVNRLTKPLCPPSKTNILDAYSKYGGIDAELLTVDLMGGHDFEFWCANALKDMGFSEVNVTPGSGDQGVDILAVKDDLKYAIQCKRYNSDLGNSPVQEVYTGKAVYHCHIAAVITNRYFTPSAKELALINGVLLWDRDWICKYIASKQNSEGSVFINHSVSNSLAACVDPEYDELLPDAVDIVLETGQASVSMLQRRLMLGYARCARMVDEMETLGIVGPFHGSNPRTILINKAEWQLIRNQL